jgi:hypothetical protein
MENKRPPPVIDHGGQAHQEEANINYSFLRQDEDDRQVEEGWLEQTTVRMLIGAAYIGTWAEWPRIHPNTHVVEYRHYARRDTNAARSAAAYRAFAATGRRAAHSCNERSYLTRLEATGVRHPVRREMARRLGGAS